ncbi:MAG: N-acetylneuraminate synthase family protein [Verrucomicrobiales bacterium]|nr:N-acetylneuraminate synthase family protein [Verrucomicrobiales bacterium]
MSWFDELDKVFVIAELGINHNGELSEALQLVRKAGEAGVDAIKIQVRDLDALYTKEVLDDPLLAEHGTQYLLEELRKAHLSHADFRELKRVTEEEGMLFFGTPFDAPSIDFLEGLDVPLYKVGSPDLTNLPLLSLLLERKKPILLSTGMAEEEEIQQVIDFLDEHGADYSMLHCNSTYPSSISDLNLRFMDRLAEMTGRCVGYSGHERGFVPSLACVARGARIIERHITMDRNAIGTDHSSSLDPSEFAEMIRQIREIESALGGSRRVFNQGEQVNRIALAKSLVAAQDLSKGTILNSSHLVSKTPARGVSPLKLNEFIGKPITKDIKADEYIRFEHIDDHLDTGRGGYEINKQWGIVGRLNDFEDFLEWKPKVVEVHLTWRDLVDFDPSSVAERYSDYAQDLVVHAPEYYQDELIDFTTRDSKILDYSLEMLSRTFDLARSLGSHFKGITDSRGPRVVIHPGGHFEARKETNRADQYRALGDNLNSMNSDGVHPLVENMPPLPWYFGGQWFQTVFTDPGEIRQFSEDFGFDLCYDTSHALLACNYHGITLSDFTRSVASHSKHLHIADGAGMTQEGLQIGDGEIDPEHLFEVFQNVDSGFVAEIWQGHLNSGEGFHKALKQVEALMKGKMATVASCSH